MTAKHLDEGAIQAYLDGELAAGAAGEAQAHLSRCAACAEALTAARAETEFFAAAFAPDEAIAVPTAALRARVGAAVARLEDAAPAGAAAERGRARESFFAPLRALFAFTPRRTAGFAGLLAVAVFAVFFAAVERRQTPEAGAGESGGIARADATPTPMLGGPPPVVAPPPVSTETASAAPTLADPAGAAKPEGAGGRGREVAVVTASATRESRPRARGAETRTEARTEARRQAADPAGEALLPGEENYRRAIASLSKAVAVGGDSVMSPKARFEYERNLALLDSAISETRRVAVRDPKDKDAVGFLMAAYQSKVEMLTAVADQAQVAALGR